MQEISLLTQFPTRKTEIKSFVLGIKRNILERYVSPLESAILLKSLEEIISLLRKDSQISEYILEEAQKNEKTFKFQGAKITNKFIGRYDFSECNDTELSLLKIQEAQLKEKIKARESYLKKIKEPTPDVDTGDTLYPAVMNGSDSISITLSE